MATKALEALGFRFDIARPIQTIYQRMDGTKHYNRARHVDSALQRAIFHIHKNTYDAAVATVIDLSSGKLYLEMTRDVAGNIHTAFTDNPQAPKCTAPETK